MQAGTTAIFNVFGMTMKIQYQSHGLWEQGRLKVRIHISVNVNREREHKCEREYNQNQLNRSVSLCFTFTLGYAYHIWKNFTFYILLIKSDVGLLLEFHE